MFTNILLSCLSFSGLIDEQICNDSTLDRKPFVCTPPISRAQTTDEKVFMGHSDGHALNVRIYYTHADTG